MCDDPRESYYILLEAMTYANENKKIMEKNSNNFSNYNIVEYYF